MALTPFNSQQLPDKSILDLNNRQAYLGNQFIAGTSVVTLADTDEHPILYLANPPSLVEGSKALFNTVKSLNCPDPSGSLIFRIYANPTGVSDGTPMTPVNCRPASTNSSIATAIESPTVISNGTLLSTLALGFSAQNIDSPIVILDASQSLLVTVQAVSPTTAIAELVWYEL